MNQTPLRLDAWWHGGRASISCVLVGESPIISYKIYSFSGKHCRTVYVRFLHPSQAVLTSRLSIPLPLFIYLFYLLSAPPQKLRHELVPIASLPPPAASASSPLFLSPTVAMPPAPPAWSPLSSSPRSATLPLPQCQRAWMRRLAPPLPMQAPRLRPPLSPGRRVSHTWCQVDCRAERLHLCPGLVLPNVYVAAVFDYIDAVDVCVPSFSVWIWGSISMELSRPSIFISAQKPDDLVPT